MPYKEKEIEKLYYTIGEVAQMFKNTYQSGFLSILYSIGSKPLQIWEKESISVLNQFTTATSNVSQIRIFSPQCSKSWAPMSPLPSLPAPKTKKKL